MTDPLEPLKLKGVVKDPTCGFVDSTTEFKIEHKDENAINIAETEKQVSAWLQDSGKAELNDGALDFIIPKDVEEKGFALYQDISDKTGIKDFVLELADDGFRAKSKQYNEHDIFVELADLVSGTSNGDFIETADDDRVIGIPYTIANIGADKYYVIDGRIYSGWAMWYGLQAIRSPENYDKNVDIAYNVPFVWAEIGRAHV